MILKGNQRAGAKNLALHLLKDENEHVEVHELRGFVSDNLVGALNEAYALSRGTKAKQFLFSLSLNPPATENVPTEVFEAAINRVEKQLGLIGQPRAVVFHEKEGRRHAHAVWSRTDVEAGRAIQLSFTKRKLMAISRELFREHGWTMPRGLMESKERDPRNFTLAQWQQAKRLGKDAQAIKTDFQDCWAVSDTQAAFAQALKERGYTLAKGDRRGFVALDYDCEVYAVPKWVGIKAKEARARLTDQDSLPTVEQARARIARDMAGHLQDLSTQQAQAIKSRVDDLEQTRLRMKAKHQAERKALRDRQLHRQTQETKQRQDRYNKGLRGLLDRITGQHRRIREQNERETALAYIRDRDERDALIFAQMEPRRVLQRRTVRLRQLVDNQQQLLDQDRSQYQQIIRREREVAKFDRKLSARHRRGGAAPER